MTKYFMTLISIDCLHHLRISSSKFQFLAVGIVILLILSCQVGDASEQKEEPLEPEVLAQTTANQLKADLKQLMGKFDPATDSNFVEIESQYADRPGRFLHKDTYASFLKMYEAAKADGINLKIISATRNFEVQKSIWEAKWNGQRKVDGMDLSQSIPDPKERALKILEYSSMPSTSRHHWGSDIDLNNLKNSYFEKGEGLKVYKWLMANAAEFGFCQTYTPKDEKRPNGYNEEKWHWSYLPIAGPLTKKAQQHLKNEMIKGFDGAEAAPLIDVVNNYVLGINKACLN